MTLLNFREAEYETLSRQYPVQAVLGTRGGGSPGELPTPDEAFLERLVRQGRLKVAYGGRNSMSYSLVEGGEAEAE